MKKSALLFSLTLCTLLLANSATAQNTPPPLSLSEAVEEALANHLQIQIAESNVEIAANNNNWATAGRFPTVSLIVNNQNSYSDINNPANPVLPESTQLGTGANATLESNWVLFDGFKVRINKERLDLLQEQSRGNANLVVENILQNVILNYYQAKLAEEQLEVVADVLQLSNDRVAYQEVRQEFGQASTFDILQSRDAFLSDSSTFLIQLENYRNTLRSLNRAMGVTDISQEYQLTDALNADPAAYQLEELQERMLNANISLRNARVNERLSEVQTDLASSNRAPQVALRAGATYDLNINKINAINPFTMMEFGTTQGNTVNVFANITARYDIYTAGARQRAIENAMVQERISKLNIEDLRQDLLLQLESAYRQYQNQLNLVDLNRRLVDNAQQNLDISRERFEGGLINSFDYRTVQLSFLNANQALLNAIFNLKVTETELMRLTGDLVR